jgi:hypothetical protein
MSGILQQKWMADSRDEKFRNEHLDKQEPAEYLGSSGTKHSFSSQAGSCHSSNSLSACQEVSTVADVLLVLPRARCDS